MSALTRIAALTAALVLSTSAVADSNRGGHHGGHHGGHRGNNYSNNWVIPALVTGAVVYGVTQYNRQPVYVQPAPVYQAPFPYEYIAPPPGATVYIEKNPFYYQPRYEERWQCDTNNICRRVLVRLAD